jgi:adhesin/invasin
VQSGDDQKATVGGALAQPVVLRVTDRFDNGVAGVAVTLAPAAGSVADSGVTTDSTGRVTVRWTLGPAVGGQKLVARAQGVDKSLEVTATATVGRVAKAAFAAPAPSSASVGRVLAPQPSVTITDAHDNPIAGATVTFTPTGGTVSAATVKTDATGRASTKWTLGPKVGPQTLTATVKGTPAKAALEVKATTGRPAAATTAPARKKGG